MKLMEDNGIFSQSLYHLYCLYHPIPTQSSVLVKEMVDDFLGSDPRDCVGGSEGVYHNIILFQLPPIHLGSITIIKVSSTKGGLATNTFMSSSSCVTLHRLVSKGSNMYVAYLETFSST